MGFPVLFSYEALAGVLLYASIIKRKGVAVDRRAFSENICTDVPLASSTRNPESPLILGTHPVPVVPFPCLLQRTFARATLAERSRHGCEARQPRRFAVLRTSLMSNIIISISAPASQVQYVLAGAGCSYITWYISLSTREMCSFATGCAHARREVGDR